MKELSIEENAKVYTELINRLEDVKDAIKKQNYGIAMDVLCKPYPQFQVITHSELKESEGERIRKEIIQFLQLPHPQFVGNRNYEKWIDYLEKQGENSVCKVKIGETYKCIASPRYTCFRTGDIYHVEDNFVAELINTCSGCFVLLEKQSEQKSEEVYNLHNYLYGKQDSIWSEEDKAILEKCIGAVKVSCYSQSFKSEAENWLKSLRPQSQWRPSDEQMDAVKDAIDYLGCNTKKVREYLMSLYEQLKKLKG